MTCVGLLYSATLKAYIAGAEKADTLFILAEIFMIMQGKSRFYITVYSTVFVLW